MQQIKFASIVNSEFLRNKAAIGGAMYLQIVGEESEATISSSSNDFKDFLVSVKELKFYRTLITNNNIFEGNHAYKWGGVANIDFRPATNFMIGKFIYYLELTREQSENNF